MLMKWPESEVELAKAFVWWLIDQRWDVYQEVQPGRADLIADIVAVRDGLVWVIETKRTLSLALLGQAAAWSGAAHYVSIGVPCLRNRGVSNYAIDAVTDRYGIGRLEAERYGDHHTVRELESPRLNRKSRAKVLLGVLRDAHRTYAEAGNSNGRRFTPFQETCDEVRRYVRDHTGCTLKEMIDNVDHHYASSVTARSAIAKWIGSGVIKGLDLRIEAGKGHLYLSDVAPAGPLFAGES